MAPHGDPFPIHMQQPPRRPENSSFAPAQPDKITLTREQIDQMIGGTVSKVLNRVTPKHGREDRGSGSIEVGRILLDHRTRLGMSQEQLAQESGVHRSTIGRIEQGDRGMSLETFAKINRAIRSKVQAIPEHEWPDGDSFAYGVLGFYAGGDD